jgi:hypothetical protein
MTELEKLEQAFRAATAAHTTALVEAKAAAQRFDERKLSCSPAEYSQLRDASLQGQEIVSGLFQRMSTARGKFDAASEVEAARVQKENDERQYAEICVAEKRASDYLTARREALRNLQLEVPMLESRLFSLMAQRKELADRVRPIPRMSQPTWFDDPKIKRVVGKGVVQ